MKWIGLILASAAVFLLTTACYLLLIRTYVAPDLWFNPAAWENTGVFGDTFGGLTAFFSALASGGVVYSLIQQQKVIDRQEKEIKDNKELALEQKTLIASQAFDSAFYNMLAIFNSMKAAIYLAVGFDTKNQFQRYHDNNLGPNTALRNRSTLDDLKKAYNFQGAYSHVLNDEVNSTFGQYLTSFECMVELIIEQSPFRERHLRYFFGQVTNLEKIILLYHYHLGEGSKPKYFDDIYVLLFRSLRESPNEVWSTHAGHFQGMLPQNGDRNFDDVSQSK